jgi:4-amino-4-deoxy-L-arabinose transferase-like glycosyltransferase
MKVEIFSKNRKMFWLLFLYGVMALAYSYLMPPWEGPDEPAHYGISYNLAIGAEYPTLDVNYEAHQPQLYYRMGAKILDRMSTSERAMYRPEAIETNIRHPKAVYQWTNENYRFLLGLYVLRWLNILFGGVALALNYFAVLRLTRGNEQVALATLAFMALIPQYLHTSSSVANDALGALAGAFAFWLFARYLTGGMRRVEYTLAVFLAFVMPFVTKLTAFPAGIAIVFGFLVGGRQWQGRRWGRYLIGAVLVAGIFLGLLWLLSPDEAILYFRTLYWRAFYINEEARSITYLWAQLMQIVRSFWGFMGWLSVPLPDWVTLLLTILALLGSGVTVWSVFAQERAHAIPDRLHRGLVVLIALVSVGAVLKTATVTVNSQGRFLFPALGVLGIVIFGGWFTLLASKFHKHVLLFVIIGMLCVNLILWIWGIIPVFYQPVLG